jgi:hypothetical protein
MGGETILATGLSAVQHAVQLRNDGKHADANRSVEALAGTAGPSTLDQDDRRQIERILRAKCAVLKHAMECAILQALERKNWLPSSTLHWAILSHFPNPEIPGFVRLDADPTKQSEQMERSAGGEAGESGEQDLWGDHEDTSGEDESDEDESSCDEGMNSPVVAGNTDPVPAQGETITQHLAQEFRSFFQDTEEGQVIWQTLETLRAGGRVRSRVEIRSFMDRVLLKEPWGKRYISEPSPESIEKLEWPRKWYEQWLKKQPAAYKDQTNKRRKSKSELHREEVAEAMSSALKTVLSGS